MGNPQPPYWGKEGNGSGVPEGIYGVWGDSQNGPGVTGTTGTPALAGVLGVSKGLGVGVMGLSAPGGTGVHGEVQGGLGVSGTSHTGTGVRGKSETGTGVDAISHSGAAVKGSASSGNGVWGHSDEAGGVRGTSATGSGVEGNSGQGVGVHGFSNSVGVLGNAPSIGVRGVASSGVGVSGESSNNFGVQGKGSNCGVVAFNSNNSNAAYLASGCCAAWFTGQVVVTGYLSKSGGGFLIDHPARPSEKFLAHSFVESSEMKNVYDGVVSLNSKGEATVKLPAWFERLNGDFRYQLTPVGAPAPGLHVAREIAGNSFKIAGGARGMKVSWQVTGVRKDPWALANPLKVEQKKSAGERGHFLHPELHGKASARSIAALRHPGRR